MKEPRYANRYRAGLILFSLVLVSGFVAPRAAAASCPLDRPDDQVWIVSTRHLGCAAIADPTAMNVQLRAADGTWQSAKVAQLVDSESPILTVVYVHGNRVNRCEAVAEGLGAYNALIGGTGSETIPPVRFVIWSWPSDRVRGPLRDVRIKARRTDLESYFLALWLAMFKDRHQIVLIGHSFGGRVVTGALHLLGGGHLAGRALPVADVPALDVRVVLLAAALHNYWLQPGCRDDRALAEVDRLLNLYNHCDSVLRHYPVLDRCVRAEALGYTGLNLADLGDAAAVVEQKDVACWIGRSHGSGFYFCNPAVLALIRSAVFESDTAP